MDPENEEIIATATEDSADPHPAEADEVTGQEATQESSPEAQETPPSPEAEVEEPVAEEPQPDDAAQQPAAGPNPISEMEKEIDSLDPFDPDAVRSSMKKMLKITADAQRAAEEAQVRAESLDKYTKRGNAFAAAAKAYGVSRTEAETLFDQQVELLASRGVKGDALVQAATARWEMAMELKKDQAAKRTTPAPAKVVKPATPVTRGGASTIPAGKAPTPVPVSKEKSFDEKVRDGSYFKFEEL